MEWIQLKTKSPFLDPGWFRRLCAKGSTTVVLNADSVAEVEGEPLIGFPYKAGTVVRVEVGREIIGVSEEEFQKDLIRRKELIRQDNLKYSERKNKAREAAEIFYSLYRIPFDFVVGRKDVLSGLSATSWGDGFNKATVHHLVLEQDFVVGRSRRYKDSYLCRTQIGKNWAGTNTNSLRYTDGNNNLYTPAITCKGCLRAMKQFLKK